MINTEDAFDFEENRVDQETYVYASKPGALDEHDREFKAQPRAVPLSADLVYELRQQDSCRLVWPSVVRVLYERDLSLFVDTPHMT